MTKRDPKSNNAPEQSKRDINTAVPERGKSDYPVGYCKPPVHTRWQPGESGNRKGRPKNRRNLKREIEEIASKTITIRDGERERNVSIAAANYIAHGVKGAKGDVRSANLFLKVTQMLGLLEDDDNIVLNEAARGTPTPASATAPSATALPPSEILFANLDLNLLTREDIAELSRLAEIIDMGGDFTALGTADFERVKYIVNKGRGKDVTPQ